MSKFSATPPPRLFHYTIQASFLSIVQNRSFWATDVRYLNDSAEYVYGINLAIVAIGDAAKDVDFPGSKQLTSNILAKLQSLKNRDYYVFSLSENGDSLSQWRSYTKIGPGYALGFSSADLRIFCEEGRLQFGKCIYSKLEAQDAITLLAVSFFDELGQYFPHFASGEINQDLIEVRSGQFADLFLRYAAFIKNPAFEQEVEWRIIASPAFSEDRKVLYRSGPHSIVPYVQLEWSEIGVLKALQQVVMKPVAHIELAEQAVNSFIKSEYKRAGIQLGGSMDFEVIKSQIPYREGA